jgi:hypothetical protein
LPDLVAAAPAFIRDEVDGVVVSITDVMGELRIKFGNRPVMSDEMFELVDLIESLWADPHIDPVRHRQAGSPSQHGFDARDDNFPAPCRAAAPAIPRGPEHHHRERTQQR